VVTRELIGATNWYLPASLLAGLLVIYFIPHIVSGIVSPLSKAGQLGTFPAAMSYMIIFAVMLNSLPWLTINLALKSS
jgi:hypothetical protein